MAPAINQHTAPQSYLKRWSVDGKTIHVYRALVSHENVPSWTQRSIERTASKPHLYTTPTIPEEPDAIETWLNTDIEQPALGPLNALEAGRSISEADWQRVVRFAMSLWARSPKHYLESTARLSETVPALLRDTLTKVERTLAQRATGVRSHTVPSQSESADATNGPAIPLPIEVRTTPSAENPGMSELRVEFTVGPQAWHFELVRALTATAPKLFALGQRWSIMRPFRDAEWFTSDHPVLMLNYYGPGKPTEYDFKGGWGNKGGDVILPLSPTRLIYAEIGKHQASEIPADRELTLRIQRMLAENAFREIYARTEHARAHMFRKRVVDARAFADDREAWAGFHAAQVVDVPVKE